LRDRVASANNDEVVTTGETWENQRERRFRLARDQATTVLCVLAGRLPAVRYLGPSPTSLVVTTYLDTPDRAYLAVADASDGRRSLKLRVREYLSSDGRGGYHGDRACYLELKERTGELRTKQRIRVAKAELGALLRRRAAPPESAEGLALTAELARLELAPVMVCAYQRRVFGEDRGLRLTFDERVAFYRPPEGLYDAVAALAPATLGPALARGPSRLLEVKQPAAAETPAWLNELLAGLDSADGYSKFRDGVHALDCSTGPVEVTRPLRIERA
jgi:hypothetical protein